MKKIFVKTFNQLVELNCSVIQLLFDNCIDFRTFIENIDSEVIYSENDNEFELSKKTIVIDNLFSLDINEKKNIAFLHKHIANFISDDLKGDYMNINSEIIKLFEKIETQIDYEIEYEEGLDMIKFFNAYQVRFYQNNEKNYFEKLLDYLNIMSKVYNIGTFITISLLRLLSNKEIEQLKYELMLKGINIIDLDINSTKKEVKYFEIDNDWCII